MKRIIKIILSDNVFDEAGILFATNESNEVYINLDHITQFSFNDSDFRFVLQGSLEEGCSVIKFSEDGMGEYHRIKREVEEYMGIIPKDSIMDAIRSTDF